jgi:hypothetical protein
MLAFASIFTENSGGDFNQSVTTQNGRLFRLAKRGGATHSILPEIFTVKAAGQIFTFTSA